ncbi:MAG: DUF2459 domain-containing protein [Candidatus Binatia bacterium]
MRVAYLLVLVLFLRSCAMAPTDRPMVLECEALRAFYVVSHGWHTGIVVNRRDLIEMVPSLEDNFSSGEYLEIGWGDERFYQAKTATLGLVLQAIFWPTPTVLHIVTVPTNPRRYFSGSESVEVSVPQSGYVKLLAFVAKSFSRTPSDGVIKLGPGLYGNSWFYRAEGAFSAFNTCNTWVAKSIETTGFPISGMTTITAEGLLSQLRENFDANMTCYSVR